MDLEESDIFTYGSSGEEESEIMNYDTDHKKDIIVISSTDEEEEVNIIESTPDDYSYKSISSRVEDMKEELIEISAGNIKSIFKNKYTGTQRERNKLIYMTRGPEGWNPEMVSKLVSTCLTPLTGMKGLNAFRFALDVLLPEVLIRVTSEKENITYEQAMKKL